MRQQQACGIDTTIYDDQHPTKHKKHIEKQARLV